MKGPLNKLEMDIFTWRNVHFQFIQRALHTASVDIHFYANYKVLCVLMYMGLLGSVPWSLNCGYYTIISLQLWNMTCYCTVHGPSMEAPSNNLQVVMHHMWWSSPKSNSKIQHQKQSFLGKLYSIMAWNWHEWIPLSVLSTVEVFSSTILHIFTCPRKQYEGVHFQFIQRAPTYCFRGQ